VKALIVQCVMLNVNFPAQRVCCAKCNAELEHLSIQPDWSGFFMTSKSTKANYAMWKTSRKHPGKA